MVDPLLQTDAILAHIVDIRLKAVQTGDAAMAALVDDLCTLAAVQAGRLLALEHFCRALAAPSSEARIRAEEQDRIVRALRQHRGPELSIDLACELIRRPAVLPFPGA